MPIIINYFWLSIWAKGCMLMIVCVLADLTGLPLLIGGRKLCYIIIIIYYFLQCHFLSCFRYKIWTTSKVKPS